MNQILQVACWLAAIVGFSVSLYNWILIANKGQDRYLVSAIGAFVMGAAFAFLHQLFVAILAALLILLLALRRWLSNKL